MVEDTKIDDIFRQPRYLLGPVAIRDGKIKKAIRDQSRQQPGRRLEPLPN